MDSLSIRMKGYEHVERRYLMRRMPAIIRIDGKAFHSLTRGFERPFDHLLIQTMWETATYLCEKVQGVKIAFIQSDEISLLLRDDDTLTTEAWFDKNIQKMVSVSASMATMAFNNAFDLRAMDYARSHCDTDCEEIENRARAYTTKSRMAMFDARVFILPKEEVCNYFIWRQQDATRNSIQMMGQANFSHEQLHEKNCNEIQEMLFQTHQINFNDLDTYLKRGACILKELYMKDGTERSRWIVDKDIPLFTADRNYIEKYL